MASQSTHYCDAKGGHTGTFVSSRMLGLTRSPTARRYEQNRRAVTMLSRPWV